MLNNPVIVLFFHSFFGWCCLFGCLGTEDGQHCSINCSCIISEGSGDLLDEVLLLFVQLWPCVVEGHILNLFSIFWWDMGVWLMLCLFPCLVVEQF